MSETKNPDIKVDPDKVNENPDIKVNNTEDGGYVDRSYSKAQERMEEEEEERMKKLSEQNRTKDKAEPLKKQTKGGRKKSLRKTNRKRKTRRRRTNRRRTNRRR